MIVPALRPLVRPEGSGRGTFHQRRQRLTEATAAPPPTLGHRLLAIGTFVEIADSGKEKAKVKNNKKSRVKLFTSWWFMVGWSPSASMTEL